MQYASPDTYAHLSDSNRASSGGSANIGTPPKLYGRLQGSDSAVGQRRQKLQTRTRTAGTGPGVTVHCLKVCVFYYQYSYFFFVFTTCRRARALLTRAGWYGAMFQTSALYLLFLLLLLYYLAFLLHTAQYLLVTA